MLNLRYNWKIGDPLQLNLTVTIKNRWPITIKNQYSLSSSILKSQLTSVAKEMYQNELSAETIIVVENRGIGEN